MIREKFTSNFPWIFPEFSSGTPEQTPKTATASSTLLIQERKKTHINISGGHYSADRKRGQRKGATSKERQTPSKSAKNIFDTFRHFSRRAKLKKKSQKLSKSAKNIFDTFRQFSRSTSFSVPFWGALNYH